uniref:LEM domain-containing protein n=1 Tax=Biomphalaria glabrata TaxID=6526 RepID=A0A2C9L6Z8_BIOGL
MAAISDRELVAELSRYGENIQLPIKSTKRPLLIKKLNHLRARSKANDTSSEKPKSRQNYRQTSSSQENSPESANNASSRSRSLTLNNQSSLRSNSSVAPRSYGLNNLSSDDNDSDVDIVQSSSFPQTLTDSQASGTNHANLSLSSTSRDKSRQSNVSDNVLRTLRRRTGELPPRRTRKSEVLELSSEQNRIYENDSVGTPEKSPVPSPARSRLYPNLSNFHATARDDTFESSDSDLDGSTYFVTNKSVNTSFQSYKAEDDEDRDVPGTSFNSQENTSNAKAKSFNDSPSVHHRNVSTLPNRRYSNGSYLRVQQYKSRYLELLPHILVVCVIIFFVGLSLTYVVIHKDYFFSWFSSPDYMASQTGKHLRCSQDGEEMDDADIATSLEVVKKWFSQLTLKKGQVLCHGKIGGDTINISELIAMIPAKGVDVKRIFSCCMQLILANPEWNIRPLKEDSAEADLVSDIIKLESTVADMTVWCRLKRSFITVLYGIFLIVCVIGAVLLFGMYIKYRIRQRQLEQGEVYAMVEKIIDILREHHELAKKDDSDEQPYLAVQHVRDQLLPPASRQQMKPIWDKAVEFIADNESRIRLETKLIRGDEFDVWHWLPPTATNGKIWQGQAFGENSENNSNQVIYSPTPCLKIRNMFDSNVESGEHWKNNVIDAILEKCDGVKNIVHVYVDAESREGCVYLKCSSCETAGQARQALHGWWFDGRLVTVKFLRVEHYHKRWPESRNATMPLKPSTNQMKSLSQPYYKSSLEMT